jgi:predicted RNase H-like HicB family nuclease
MRTIHITHHHEPGHGWSFESPDLPGLIGGTEDNDYEAARRHAESAARFHLECEAGERGEPVETDVRYVHRVPTSA